jgi:hypothetical protein
LKDKWFCQFGDTTKAISFFAFGDSHALSLIPALEAFSNANRLSVGFAGMSNCPPLLDVQSLTGEANIRKFDCKQFNKKIFAFIKERKIQNVILIARWAMYSGGGVTTKKLAWLQDDVKYSADLASARDIVTRGLQRTLNEFRALGVNVFILEDNPQQTKSPHEVLRLSEPTDDSINTLSVSKEENAQNQLWVTSLLNEMTSKDATLIKTNDLFCESDVCPLARQGQLLYFDDNHLTNAGSLLLSSRLDQILLNRYR